MVILHYIFDPLCGWCYGAAPLIKAAHAAGVKINLHGGGLWDPAKKIDSPMIDHIISNDSSINSMTGQTFSQKYIDQILRDPETMLWSQPPIDAILAAGKLQEQSSETCLDNQLAMMEAIQVAYYVSGRRVMDHEVLIQISDEIDLPPEAFKNKLNANAASKHTKQTRKFMKSAGVSGFPSLVIEKDDKTMHRVEHSKLYGKPDKFVKQMKSMI